ncbi:hypothetical protein Ssi03_41540 [Sphaerisporangium siamense]|uniref:Uncharacterized protein n=1 Tax=Sphaerisporangium siamense TaxID=795645 RepID=A0A7W7DD16_9ACTN|nr:hypothetical protein [Sphaerisporangium siamense]MBB4704552.1 hypothetical protein [Sphaerisporangium siamense]GII86164.1 hypothetical protein Ssi03_41540 [Sphaerisporangium siamense]
MGYTTEFKGRVRVGPPLNSHEIHYLTRFASTRRMNRRNGPYYCGTGFAGQDHEPDIVDYSRPPAGQPSLWCQWTPTEDGHALEWNGAEKFYDPVEWMAYLIDTFLRPGATVQQEMVARVPAADGGGWYAPEFAFFTCDHVLNGEILAQGEEFDDRWTLRVTDNVVERLEGHHREPYAGS